MGADEESAGFARYREHEWSDVRQANWWQRELLVPEFYGMGSLLVSAKQDKEDFFPMLDINLLRTNPELVKENIRKKFQDEKLVMVDEVVEMDKEYRAAIQQADTLRNQIKVASKQIGMLMGKGQKEEAEKAKEQVAVYKADLEGLAAKEDELQAEIRKRMLVIPNIIDPSVPIGKDDSQNVEIERFGEPVVPDFEIPYHVDIMERLHGIDLDSARKTSGNGFYYLMGDIARLHSAILSYGRDFMIDRGFTYCIPPYMIHGDVVTGVMSFAEMENMMYKIEGEDLYLIGTSEHSMIGKFIDTILDESQLPQTLTSYSPLLPARKLARMALRSAACTASTSSRSRR